MRFRYKPWALPEIEASPYVCLNPDEYKYNWQDFFAKPNLPLSLELGSGKGRFLQTIAQTRPDYNYLGIDVETIAVAMANRLLLETEPDNARLLRLDIANISAYFAPGEVREIFINFPNPWPKKRHNKRRLTHPRQLIQYRDFLEDGGEIRFKTDDQELFNHSLEYFKLCKFEIITATDNLAITEQNETVNIMTEYEERWRSQGISIKAIHARKLPCTAAEEQELAKFAREFKFLDSQMDSQIDAQMNPQAAEASQTQTKKDSELSLE